MKQYEVRMNMTAEVAVVVYAETPEEAKKNAMEKAVLEEAHTLSNYDKVHEREVIEINECEDDDANPILRAAIEYVHQTIPATDVAIIRAKIDKNYEMHLNPSCGINTSNVEELLDEYGETYENLPLGWWEKYGDMDDILLKL